MARSASIRWLIVAMVGLAAGAAGCTDDSSGVVDGPVGPVGSVGPTELDDDVAPGSGVPASEERRVGDFDRVVLAGEGAVTVVVGEGPAVTVETDDNLLDLIETDVRDGVLEIATTAGVDIAPSNSVTYEVEVPALRAVAISGAGSIDVDLWSADEPRIELTGVGNISVAAVESTELTVEHHGVGAISISGTTVNQSVRMSGVGDYDASGLDSRTASVEASGSSSATLWVTGTLDVAASNTSTVSYYGSPELTQQIDDLASLVALGERNA